MIVVQMSHQLLWTDLLPESVLNNWNSIDFRILVTGYHPEYLVVKVSSLRPKRKKNHMFLVRISIQKRSGWRFFCYLSFPIACFLYTLLSSPRDTLELLGQILIKRNIRYWLNTSLLNFDTYKGLTVKNLILSISMRQRRTKYKVKVKPVGFGS